MVSGLEIYIYNDIMCIFCAYIVDIEDVSSYEHHIIILYYTPVLYYYSLTFSTKHRLPIFLTERYSIRTTINT